MATTSKQTGIISEIDGTFQPHEHLVQFYETDAFFLDALSKFIEAGFDAGNSCIVIITKEHQKQLEEHLQGKGRDLAIAQKQGKYLMVDAVETLPKFMVDGLPEPQRFASIVGSIIEQAATGQSHVRIVGEMVTLLWKQGNPVAAMRLEDLWNDLAHKTHPFSLLCTYPMQIFASEAYAEQFTTICQQHTQAIPDENYTLLASQDDRLRTIALLQQKANSLEAEIAERKATEERLQSAESHYRSLFEASRDGILIVDPRTHLITNANPCMTELLGYTREELLGRELWQIGLFQDQKSYLEVFYNSQDMQFLHREMLPTQKKHGELRFVDFISNRYQANGVDFIQCYIRDVTEHKQAEERLLYLAAIVESSNDAILSKDLKGTITSWNAAAERMYGYSAQEIVGQPVTILFPPDQHAEFRQIMTHIRQGENIASYETIRVRKDGILLIVAITISPIKDRNGTIIGASTIARDITEQKQLEARYRQLFDSNLIGVFVSDFAGTFLDANDAFLDLLGYTRTDLQSGTVQRDVLTPNEFHDLSQNAVKALQETGASGTYEKEYQHKNGKRIPVMVAVTRIEQTENCIGFVLDISERKELDKRKDEFISMASHELKTPVTSLKGFLTLLQRRLTIKEDEKALHYLTRMDAQVNKLTKLINDLLDISKMQTGQLAYREEVFEMDALLQETIENIQGTTQTHHLQLEGESQAEVRGDRDRIGQVLINLLNNAIKYSPQADTVLIHIAKDHNQVLIDIQDFGIGIAKEYQDKIFERFYQVTDPEEKTYPGLGIGLYISCGILKRHGGQMWVESQKSQGATFHVALPLLEEG